MNDFQKSATRRKVRDFFERNEIPTLKKITDAINSDTELPSMTKVTLFCVLKDLNFVFA